jgi:hypothetical protein
MFSVYRCHSIGIAYMSIWSSPLELNGDSGEQQNLNSCTGSIPERSRNAYEIVRFSVKAQVSFLAYRNGMRQKNFATV